MQEDFFRLADALAGRLRGDEVVLFGFDGEDSDFARINRNRVRQAGHVRQRELRLNLVEGQRHIEGRCDLSGDPADDLDLAAALLGRLRDRLPHVPDDPYLHFAAEAADSIQTKEDLLPDSATALAEIIAAAEGLDLVGLWASGPIYRGFASSLGQRCWHQSAPFNLDWSCYAQGDKAVKASYSGFEWDGGAPGSGPGKGLRERMARLREMPGIMAREPKTVPPGRYRAYLAPDALAELMDMLAWGGFGLKSHRTAQTPLLKLVRGERRLHQAVTLQENNRRGLAPSFTGEGFLKPPTVTLITAGAYGDCLVSARSAKEYGQAVNAAAELPESPSLAAGDLPSAAMLTRLGTGIYIGNLWYCNYSDRNDCRITGMTRFGTFWVEGGQIRAPLNVMRFDDSIYHLLGDRLEGLTRERELILSAETYGGRSTTSYLLPGALISEMSFTL